MRRKTLRHDDKYQVILWGTLGCDVRTHPVLAKLLLNTEKAEYIIYNRHRANLYPYLESALVSLSMQCLFTPTLISKYESCEYDMVTSHFSKLLCE